MYYDFLKAFKTVIHVLAVADEDTEQYVDHNCGCCERCCVNYVCWLRFQNNLEKVGLQHLRTHKLMYGGSG